MTGYKKLNIEYIIDTANDALEHLYNAKEYLTNASNLGILDMIGGKFIVTGLKHNTMYQAQDELDAAVSAIKELQRWTTDLTDTNGLDIDFSDFLQVSDLLFDNIFMDIFAQSKIKKAREAVDSAIARIELLLDDAYRGDL
ncbi:MAG: hypothetical protein IJJ24_04400 [Solobacterium sp.]|nr:hypothetical protein [Erysipelotrichaceae bacterium]MBQ2690231.1 hypothetical protein [Solobacterium sp.]MBR0478318.1 hypothetical protein [Solobacterium sp.]